MRRKITTFLIGFTLCMSVLEPAWAEEKLQPGVKENVAVSNLVWSEPIGIGSRDLLLGPGGAQRQPRGPMTFLEEDTGGTNPKFSVRDQDGTRWKVKLGLETRPETVATHLLWAVGFFADEDYFLPSLVVEKMPTRLSRGQSRVGPGGQLENVRLERYKRGEEKLGEWTWKKNPLVGTREFNGLRVMMALMNNWDLKDQNNSIYEEKEKPSQKRYVVTDLGATFGTTGFSWTDARSKGNLKSYSHSRFISKVTPEYVDFNVPTRPALFRVVAITGYISRVRMRWIGKRIPRSDVKWMAGILSQLSAKQIRDAFRAGGYSPNEVEGFAKTVEQRIAELKNL